MPSRKGLPSGLLTFVFTDLVNSTSLVLSLGDHYRPMLIEYRQLIRRFLTAADGIELSAAGDECFFVFVDADSAMTSCLRAQQGLDGPDWPTELTRPAARIGLNTGYAQPIDGEYTSVEVHRAARIAATARSGQVLCSAATADHLTACIAWVHLVNLGLYRLRGFDREERLFEATPIDPEQLTHRSRTGRHAKGNGRDPGRNVLTRAESTVAKLVADGLSNPQIATQLCISRHTVETHLKHIFVKLDVTSRAALAAAIARRVFAGEL